MGLCFFDLWKSGIILRSLSAVTILDNDAEDPLPLVLLEMGDVGQQVGFLDRRCLDPGPLTEMEFQNQRGHHLQFMPVTIAPSIQSVIHSNIDPELLTMEIAPLGPKALAKVRYLQKARQETIVDFGAITEIKNLPTPEARFDSFLSYLTTSKLDFTYFHLLEKESRTLGSESGELAGEAILWAYSEIVSSKTPNCQRISNAMKFYFFSGIPLVDSNVALAVYSFLYSEDPRFQNCAAVIEEGKMLLGTRGLTKPFSPYERDQTWRASWGIDRDAQIRAAFPGSRVKIIHDDGPLGSEKRIIAQIPGLGTVEEFKTRKGMHYRWIERPDDTVGVRSSQDLESELKKRWKTKL